MLVKGPQYIGPVPIMPQIDKHRELSRDNIAMDHAWRYNIVYAHAHRKYKRLRLWKMLVQEYLKK